MSRPTTRIVICRPDGPTDWQYEVEPGEHKVGRDSNETSIFIGDQDISPEHALITIGTAGIEVRDLDSETGTFIKDGDKTLQVGNTASVPLKPHQKLWLGTRYSVDFEKKETLSGTDRYTWVRMLGRGSQGEVWLATDNQLDKKVALKKLGSTAISDELALEDMRREVQKNHVLSHPNIVRTFDLIQQPEEDPFICMEFVEGDDLCKLAASKPEGAFTWGEIKDWIVQLTDALEHAHKEKIVHRDVKPGNIMITKEGRLKLSDFGVAAKIVDSQKRSSVKGVLAGTIVYMSPQQVIGKVPRQTDDIYAFGATIYELLTGQPPFYTGDVSHQLLNIDPVPLTERLAEFGIKSEIPPYLEELVLDCLAKDPKERPQSMDIIRDRILNEGRINEALPRSPREDEQPNRKRVKYILATVLLFAVILMGIWFTGQIGQLTATEKEPQSIDQPRPAGQPTFEGRQVSFLKKGLVAYYPFNGNAKDESGNGNDGEVKGVKTTTDRYGNTNKAYNLNGQNTWIEINQVNTPANLFTYSIWFKPVENPPVSEFRHCTLISKETYDETYDNRVINWLGIEYARKNIRLHTARSDDYIDSPRQSFQLKNWAQATCTFDGDISRIYVNGLLVKEGVTPIARPFNPCKFIIGRDSSNQPEFFAGDVDDVRIYNRALSANEVKALYDFEKPKTGLKKGLAAYYPFNGNAKDESGNGNDGAFKNGPVFVSDAFGRENRAVRFDGAEEILAFPFTKTIEQNFSFSFWAKPESETLDLPELSSGNSIAGNHQGLIFSIHGKQTGKAGIGVNLGTNGIYVTEHADHHLPATLVYTGNLSGWKHYTIVVENNRPKLYINGELERKGLISGKIVFWASTIYGVKVHPGSTYRDDGVRYSLDGERGYLGGIGRGPQGSYRGCLDELRVYDRALRDEEVKGIYKLEKPES